MCLLISRVLRLSPWQHPSIHPCLVSLLFIPSLYSTFLFLAAHWVIFFTLRNNIILPEAVCCCLPTPYFYAVLLELRYNVCMHTNFHCYNCYYGPVIGIFIDRVPEATCCCLQTYTSTVNDVLLVMYRMCLLAFIFTSADIRQLWVYLCYSLVVVYKLVMFMWCC